VRDSPRRARAAANIIPQTFDPGGKSANVDCLNADADADADADVAAAAKSAMVTTLFNKGEVCIAGIRVFVQRSVYGEFTDAVQRLVSRVTQRRSDRPGGSPRYTILAGPLRAGVLVYRSGPQ
jgi:acyl-CoA reductase-like NAD-dependent aldehyde dehydrogenase